MSDFSWVKRDGPMETRETLIRGYIFCRKHQSNVQKPAKGEGEKGNSLKNYKWKIDKV